MKSLARILVCSGVLLLLPVTASAQVQLTLFVGGNFGGDSGVSLDESITGTSAPASASSPAACSASSSSTAEPRTSTARERCSTRRA
jgi:hypothetical protein